MTTQQSEIDVLKAQVKTLDAALAKQSRRTKHMSCGFGCLFVAGIALAATSMQGVPDVIQAKKFEVINDEGKQVVEMIASAEGGFLAISNKDGKAVAGLAATANGGVLDISNKAGKIIAALYASPDGGGLGIGDNAGKVIFEMPVKEVAGP